MHLEEYIMAISCALLLQLACQHGMMAQTCTCPSSTCIPACRYAGMIAWRGVVKGDEHPELLQQLKADFGNLDRGIIFDLSPSKCMNLIYLLPGNRINWLW